MGKTTTQKIKEAVLLLQHPGVLLGRRRRRITQPIKIRDGFVFWDDGGGVSGGRGGWKGE